MTLWLHVRSVTDPRVPSSGDNLGLASNLLNIFGFTDFLKKMLHSW